MTLSSLHPKIRTLACAIAGFGLLTAAQSVSASPTLIISVQVTSAADDDGDGCTLREALVLINNGTGTAGLDASGCTSVDIGASSSSNAVTFASNVTGTITLDGGNELTIAQPTVITGPGADKLTIDADNSSRIFAIGPSAATTVLGLTLTNGHSLGGSSSSAASSASSGGGGQGGAIYASSPLTIIASVITDSTANDGGGIYVETGNSLDIIGSTLSGNTATSGGGVYSDSELTLVNSTLSANSASGGSAFLTSGGVTLTNSTISEAGNSPPTNGTVFMADGAALTGNNTILDGSCVSNSGNASDVGFNAGSNNLVTDASCIRTGSESTVIGGASIDPVALNLGALANNGGPTQTMALDSGSPAIGAGDAGVCTSAPVSGLDQRGFVRPSPCSVGAFDLSTMNGFGIHGGTFGLLTLAPLLGFGVFWRSRRRPSAA